MAIEIQSHSDRETVVKLVETQQEADHFHALHAMVKLFYDEHSRYGCYSQNWGASKGQDHYDDVCVVLNGTTLKAYQKGTLRDLAPMTKNKFYVACSRARGDLYFVSEQMYKKHRSS